MMLKRDEPKQSEWEAKVPVNRIRTSPRSLFFWRSTAFSAFALLFPSMPTILFLRVRILGLLGMDLTANFCWR